MVESIKKDSYTREEYIEMLRNASGARATLYYCTLLVLREKGIDYKNILKDIVVKYEDILTKDIKLYNDNHTPKDYAEMFICGDTADAEAFGQEFISADNEKSIIRMHDCPLVAMWKKLNIPIDEMKELCDIANIMDYEFAKRFGGVNLEITSQMGYGDKYCELIATKK